jgi:hypothetical protein
VVDVGVYVGEGFGFEGVCGRFEVGVGLEVGVEVSVGVVVVLRGMDRFVGVGASRTGYSRSVGEGGRHSSLMVWYVEEYRSWV